MRAKSIVTVHFNDGTSREYEITASPSLAGYLARGMSDTGNLTLWNDEESFVIPAHSIREFSIRRRRKATKKDDVET